MKSYLNSALISTFLALVMIACFIINISTANWIALPICIIAFILNVVNAVKGWKFWYKEWKENNK